VLSKFKCPGFLIFIFCSCAASFRNASIVYQCTLHPAMAGGIYMPPGTPLPVDIDTFLGGHNTERSKWTGLNLLAWDGRLVGLVSHNSLEIYPPHLHNSQFQFSIINCFV
jgi:hypothetical protein